MKRIRIQFNIGLQTHCVAVEIPPEEKTVNPHDVRAGECKPRTLIPCLQVNPKEKLIACKNPVSVIRQRIPDFLNFGTLIEKKFVVAYVGN